MDNPETESTSASLSEHDAAAAFSSFLEPQAVEEEKKEEASPEPQAETEPESETPPEEATDDTITLEVDGKPVTLTKAELAETYKSGLRQSDYTRKTMEVAEQRKAADAELQKARQEREQYAGGLQQAEALLRAQLQEHAKVDWQALLESDPVEYLKQQHLVQQRQAQLQQTFAERQKLDAIRQAEAQQTQKAYLEQQAQELLAKLPDWKDEAKAKAEKNAIREFLLDRGFTDAEVSGIGDHRAVMLAREAMLYRQMIAKAQAAAKKVESLPTKVQRPGSESQAIDKRTSAFQRFSKSGGKMEDAAAVFASIL